MSVDLPDPRTIRTDPCPDGWHYEWVAEPAVGWMAWRVLHDYDAPHRCRFINGGVRCEAPAVAKLNRGLKREQWWHYCGDHLYGRRVSGRRVWVIHTVRSESKTETP